MLPPAPTNPNETDPRKTQQVAWSARSSSWLAGFISHWRSFLLFLVLMLVAAPAAAHDPAKCDRMMQAQDAPKSASACEVLAEPRNTNHPDTAGAKALKTRCEAEKKAAAKKSVSETK